MIQTSRRRFIGGLLGIIVAPAVVKASSLMKISAPKPLAIMWDEWREPHAEWLEGMSQRVTNTLFYGNWHPEIFMPREFQGFVPRYSSLEEILA